MKKITSLLSVALMLLSGMADEAYGPFGYESGIAEDVQQCAPTVYDVDLTIKGSPAQEGDCIAAYRASDDALCGLGMAYDSGAGVIRCDLVLYSFKDEQIYFKAWQSNTPVTAEYILDVDSSCNITAPTPGSIDVPVLALLVPVAVTTYTITYKPGAYGTGLQQTAIKTKDAALALKGAIFTRTGYTQTGWATSDGGSKAYSLSAPYTANAALTLYPLWTANTYMVTFDRQSGNGGASCVNAKYGSDMPSIIVPTRTGYTFNGYYTSIGGNGTQYYTASGTSSRIWDKTVATTLYAKWTANKYTVKFDAAGGTGGWTKTLDYGSAIAAPAVTRSGYTFKGWTPAVAKTVPVGGATYTAQWTANKYTVKFDANGGTGGWTKELDFGTLITPPTVTRIGYTFKGWTPSVSATVPVGGAHYMATWIECINWEICDVEGGVAIMGGATISGDSLDGNIEIPEEIDGKKVVGIADWAFYQAPFRSLSIPSSVVWIGDRVFQECRNLKNITIPDSVESIGEGAFVLCDHLENAVLSSGMSRIEDHLFFYCGALTSVTIPSSITSIGEGAFVKCHSLANVKLPAKLVSIETEAFRGCSGLSSMTIPASVVELGGGAFSGCPNLLSMTVAKDNREYKMIDGLLVTKDGATLVGCFNSTVHIADGITAIGSGALAMRDDLTDFVVPDAITMLDSKAFYCCANLVNVTIGGNVTNIGEQAFSGCESLRSVTIPHAVNSVGCDVFSFCGCLERAVIEAPITEIPEDMFFQCEKLVRVSLPETITNIEMGAFYRCKNLLEITIPAGVDMIDQNAFYECSGMTNIVFEGNAPETVWSLPPAATVKVHIGSTGWRVPIPGEWKGCKIEYLEQNLPSNDYVSSAVLLTGSTGSVKATNVGATIEYGEQLTNAYAHAKASVWWKWKAPQSGRLRVSTEGSDFDTILGVYMETSSVDLTVADLDLKGYNDDYNGRQSVFEVEVYCGITYYFAVAGYADEGAISLAWSLTPTTIDNPDPQPSPEPAATSVIVFDANGGNGGWQKTLECGALLNAPIVTRQGYTFVGWSSEVPSVVPAGGAVYTAQWTANKYTVTFDANGGTGGWTKTLDYGSAIAAPAVTRTGYTFKGWTPAVAKTVPVGGATYTAQWTANKYTVTFDANGGTGGWTKTLDYGSAIAAPAVTRTGYKFVGWTPAVAATVPAEDVTYVAQWSANAFTITFDANGGRGGWTRTLNGDAALKPPSVTRDGYDFAGWTPAVPAKVPLVDATYTAQWELKTYTIAFDANGGSGGGTSSELHAGDEIDRPDVGSNGSMVFAGWEPVPPAFAPASNATYVAQWVAAAANTWDVRSVAGGVAIKGCSFPYGKVEIPAAVNGKKVVAVMDYAFFGQKGVTEVVIPASVESIGTKAFKGCANLTKVTMPARLATLGQAAFQDCVSLTEVDVPPLGDNYLWSSTFEGCTALKRVSIPEGVTAIGTSSFANCKALVEVNIPKSVKNVKSFAFFSCERLADVELPAGLVKIEQKAFKNCTSMTEIEIPSGVTSLGKAVFFNSGLVEATVPGRIAKVDDYCFQKCAALRKVTLSEGVTETGASVWANDGALVEVVFPKTLEKLGGYAFFRCPSLTTLWNFSSLASLSTIGEKAFKHCTSLKTLAMPSQVTALPKEMCNYCASLEGVYGTVNVTSIGQSAFSNCPKLKSVAGLDAAALETVKRGREWRR